MGTFCSPVGREWMGGVGKGVVRVYDCRMIRRVEEAVESRITLLSCVRVSMSVDGSCGWKGIGAFCSAVGKGMDGWGRRGSCVWLPYDQTSLGSSRVTYLCLSF